MTKKAIHCRTVQWRMEIFIDFDSERASVMNFRIRGKFLIASIATAATHLAWAVTATPSTVTLTAGASQTVNLSRVSGTVSVINSNPSAVSVAKIDTSSYRLKGLTVGAATIQFNDRNSKSTVKVSVAGAPAEVISGRLLASNCFQCHGTNGSGGFDKLAGKSSNSIYDELKGFASGKEDPNGIMAAHAMGFSDAQLKSIANYFSSIR